MRDVSQNKPLSKREEKEFKEFESVIVREQQGFYPMGVALIGIQEQKLYRTQFNTFEEYLKVVCSLCERQYGTV